VRLGEPLLQRRRRALGTCPALLAGATFAHQFAIIAGTCPAAIASLGGPVATDEDGVALTTVTDTSLFKSFFAPQFSFSATTASYTRYDNTFGGAVFGIKLCNSNSCNALPAASSMKPTSCPAPPPSASAAPASRARYAHLLAALLAALALQAA
jgi:hypothetical protein